MSTGPEHYREAERLLAAGESVVEEIRAAKGDETRRDALGRQAMGIWAQAQAHATLALAAATAAGRHTSTFAEERSESVTLPDDHGAWAEAIGPRRPTIVNHPPEAPTSDGYECCASGSCEVCKR